MTDIGIELPYYVLTGINDNGIRINQLFSIGKKISIQNKQKNVVHGCVWICRTLSHSKKLVYRIRNGEREYNFKRKRHGH